MCIAVTTTWINTSVTPEDIRRVFYRQSCLVCILAKRNKDSKLIWARRPAPPLPPAQPPPPTSPSPKPLSCPDTKSDITTQPSTSSAPPPTRSATISNGRLESASATTMSDRSAQRAEHRGVPTVHRIPRHPQQISLLLPSQDLQRGHLPLPPPAGPTILH